MSITLQDYMIEGTYTITYRRDYETRTTSFDVAGETIRVAEARLAGANRSIYSHLSPLWFLGRRPRRRPRPLDVFCRSYYS